MKNKFLFLLPALMIMIQTPVSAQDLQERCTNSTAENRFAFKLEKSDEERSIFEGALRRNVALPITGLSKRAKSGMPTQKFRITFQPFRCPLSQTSAWGACRPLWNATANRIRRITAAVGFNMKFQILSLFLCLTASHASADAPSAYSAEEICASPEFEERFVFKLSKELNAVQICSQDALQRMGDDCDPWYGGESQWSQIVDLNGDGYFDLIIHFYSGGMWTGKLPFAVFLNCHDNTFVNILYDSFASVVADPSNGKDTWVQLHATREYPHDEENSDEAQRYGRCG
jgi:hypothetical protein